MTSQSEHDEISMRQAGSPQTMIDEPAVAPDTVVQAPLDAPDWPESSDWQPLPARAGRVFLYVALLIAVPPMCVASIMVYENLQQALAWPIIGGLWVLALSLAVWVAHKRYRYTFWKLDADGFSVRRGRLWQWETRVPTSRVQHLDIKRGPLERPHQLSSLVLHTAGTRMSAVSISGLDAADAEHLRNHFSRQIDRQEDDDHANA